MGITSVPSGKTPATSKGSLQDRIRTALESDLQTGELRPGMAIDEQALCKRFSASRTPVREALLLLAAKGLVSIIPRSGIFVRQLMARELVAMMEGLAELEGVLARLAAARISTHLKDELIKALEQTSQRAIANDPAGYARANMKLHEIIYEASGNSYIVEQTRQLRLRIAPYRKQLFEKPGRLIRSQAEHLAVVNAICQGNTEEAAEAMRDHVSAGGKVFAELVLSTSAAEPVYSRQQKKHTLSGV